MIANIVTEHTAKVIPLVRPEVAISVAPENGTGDVFSEVDAENIRRDDATVTRRGEDAMNNSIISNGGETVAVADRLATLLEKLAAEKLAINVKGRALSAEILTHPDTAVTLLEHVTANDSSNSPLRYAQGMDALLAYLDVGAAVKTGELADKAATELLASRFLRDQVKDALVEFGIFIKQENNTYRWANLPELQAAHARLYEPQMSIDQRLEDGDLRLTGNSRAIGLQLIAKKFAIHPIARMRQWQMKRYRLAAMADPWVKYDEQTNTVEVLGNEYDPKAKCPRSEKAKALIREAEIAEAKARLEAKIAGAKDKKMLQEIREIGLEGQREQAQLMREAYMRSAQLDAQRLERNARLASYKPLFAVAGFIAVGLFLYANGGVDEATHNYPVEMAAMPLSSEDSEEVQAQETAPVAVDIESLAAKEGM